MNLTIKWRGLLALLLSFVILACGRATAPTPPALILDRELSFYDWDGDMPQSVLDAFTQEFGVAVRYETYLAQEDAIENLKAGKAYDVIVMESRFIPQLVKAGLLAEIDYRTVSNFKNIAANFRDLAYDPGNKYSIPYNWGTTGLVVRSDLLKKPVTSWNDLWDSQYAGKTAIWVGQQREVIALALKSLGYSANSEKPAELQAALARLIELKPRVLYIEDYNSVSSGEMLANGTAVIAMGYARDVLDGRAKNPAVAYVLPQEGALLWGDTFIISTKSARRYTAQVFLNFLLRGDINAQIANENQYATPNDAARPFIQPTILNDPVIFPVEKDIKNAEIILPLSPDGQILYDKIWKRFLDAPGKK
jgi:spermidine/putrescine transport system substrate-binding protein